MANKSNTEVNIRIGRLLQSAREYKKVTQNEMSKAIDMSKNQISALECGQSKASIELLIGYCKKLSMTPNEILGYTDKEILPELKDLLSGMTKEEQGKVIDVIKIIKG